MARTTFQGPVISQNGFAGPNSGAQAAALANVLANTATLDFPSIAAASQADLTIAVAGAVVGDEVALGLPAAPAAGLVFNAFVSAANVVTVRATNVTAGAVDAASGAYSVTVFQTVAVPAAQP